MKRAILVLLLGLAISSLLNVAAFGEELPPPSSSPITDVIID